MKTWKIATLALIAGAGLGAGAIEALHAQAKPPAFYIAMNEVTDTNGYLNEFAKDASAYAKEQGGRFIVQGGKPVALAGEALKGRIVIEQWRDMDALTAWYNSPKNVELRKIAEKYATVHNFAVEGVAQ
jgi:uncharacterized protein (DUF1330 family)